MEVFIRADGSQSIGMGHLMRCLTIADAFSEKGITPVFLVADDSGTMVLEQRGYRAVALGTDYTRMEDELVILQERFAEKKKRFFLVDSYYVTKAYTKGLRKLGMVYYMDDVEKMGLDIDGVINYNLYGENVPYSYGDNVEKLLGVQYAPMRKVFGEMDYRVKETVTDVCITTGGGDMYDFAGAFVEFVQTKIELEKETWWSDIHFHVISGSFNPHTKELQKKAEGCSYITVHTGLTDLSPMMASSDMVISAAGSTIYEVMAMGVPVITFYFVENQRRIAEALAHKTESVNGGNYAENPKDVLVTICREIEGLGKDIGRRQRLHDELKRLTDGRGAERLAECLKKSMEKHYNL